MNTRTARFRRLYSLAALPFAVSSSSADTNTVPPPDDLLLRPPHPELPPSCWEQHGGWLLATVLLLIALLAAIGWWRRRPRLPVAIPIEIQTRRALELLRRRTEDGWTLSEISRWLRRYLIVAFELPQDEVTTSELCRVIRSRESIGVELGDAVAEFLHRCDELKFAPAQPAPTFHAAERALQLVELGETRRALLHQTASAKTTKHPDQSP